MGERTAGGNLFEENIGISLNCPCPEPAGGAFLRIACIAPIICEGECCTMEGKWEMPPFIAYPVSFA